MGTLLKSGNVSEESIHKGVMKWVRLHPAISPLVFHFPNEGPRTLRYGRLLREMGMRAGVSDLFIAMGSHGFYGAWIELKSEKGVLKPHQRFFLNDMSKQNYFTAVCRSLDRAISTIDWYCFKPNDNKNAILYMYCQKPISMK